jgi:peroxiredoxin
MGRGTLRTLRTGDRAPAVSLREPDGREVSMDSLLAAGPLLLVFYKVSCPTCQFTLPYVDQLSRSGVQVVFVCQDGAADARAFNQEFGLSSRTLLDPQAAGYPASNAFGLTYVPSLFLIEPDGRIVWSSVGWVKGELEALAGRNGTSLWAAGAQVPESVYG